MRKDWIEVKLGDALSLSKEKHKPDNIESIFYIGLEHIEKGTGQLAKSTSEEEIHTIKNKFNNGDILYGKLRPNLNKAHLAKCNGVCSTDILVLTAKQGVLANYCLKFMLSRKFVNDMSENTNGVNLPRVSTQYIQNYHLPLAPLPEQRAIVAKIDQLFSELDNGIASFKTAQAQLEIYRQSVLKKAFEGELTKEWRDQQQLSLTGWRETTLDKLTLSISDGDHQAPPKTTNGIPFITISNIKNNTINFANTFYVDDNYYDKLAAHRKPLLGDILYTVTGSFGIPVLIEFEKKFCFQRHIGLIRALESINRKWLFWLLSSDLVFKQAQTTATGTAQKTVALSSLRKFIVPVCSIEEQEQIVQEIESRLSVCDKLTETIKAELDKAEALRQSILKKAFEGRLLTDAELAACRQEPDWESADKLLTRIKTEPQTTPKTKKTQQGKS